MQVRKSIGPFAAPKAVHIVPDLPKTRSGKIMRRILRKILAGEEDQLGDVTTVSLKSPIDEYLYANAKNSFRIPPLLKRLSTLSTRRRGRSKCMPNDVGGVGERQERRE